MINLRIYRATIPLALVAIGVAMFSLQSIPEGRTAAIAPDAFDGTRAAGLTRELAKLAPEPKPGSDSDLTLADQVAQRLGQIGGSEISQQEFSAEFDGEDAEMRNVIATLPGQSERQVVLMAGRDVARGPGQATALASTASLLEIASGFGGSTHTKTLVFVSTDGSELGAEGARRFADGYSDIDRVDAIVVLSQPAARVQRQPTLIPWSAGPQSTSIELSETAAKAITDETKRVPSDQSVFSELSRLAIPSGLGEQAPLIETGIDAIRISSSGELPPEPDDDELNDISSTSLGQFGRAALGTMLALDSSPAELEHGPGVYIGLAGNLMPGWAISTVALLLILPLFLVAFDAMARALRSPDRVRHSLGWVAGRTLPFLAALLLTYIFGLVGLIPTPEFPYDPARYPPGTRGQVAMGLIAVVIVAGIIFVRPLRTPPIRAASAAAPVCVALIALTGIGVWVADPYLALLLAPALHASLLLISESTAVGSLLATAITLLGLAPVIAAVALLANRLEVGWEVPWQLLILLGDGQISFALAALGCVLAGCALAALTLARSRIVAEPPEITVRRRPKPDQAATPDPKPEAPDAAPEPQVDSGAPFRFPDSP